MTDYIQSTKTLLSLTCLGNNKFLFLVLLFLIQGCQRGPAIVSPNDYSADYYHVDTLFLSEGGILVGDFWVPTANEEALPLRIWLLSAAIVIIIALSFMALNRHIRIRALQKTLAEYYTAIHQLEERADGVSSTVLNLIIERISMIKRLTDTHRISEQQLRAFSYQDKLDALKDKVNSYHSYLNELRKDTFFFGSLEAALNAGDDNIMDNAHSLLGDTLQEKDYIILSCIIAGMKPASISFVTGIEPGTIRTKKSRIKARLAECPPSPERDVLIYRIDNPVIKSTSHE